MLAELHVRVHVAVHLKITRLADAQNHPEPTPFDDVSVLEKRLIGELTDLRTVLDNTQFEIHIANPFPKDTYEAMLAKLGTLFRSLLLIGYSAQSFPTPTSTEPSPWQRALRENIPSHSHSSLQTRLTSALAACGTSLTRAHPLPPFVDVPDHWSLLQALKGGKIDLLDKRFDNEEGYEVLVTLHTAALLAAGEVRELVELVEQVVGRMGFGVEGSREEAGREV